MHVYHRIVLCIYQQALSSVYDSVCSKYEQMVQFANKLPSEQPLFQPFTADFIKCGQLCHLDENCNVYVFESTSALCYQYKTFIPSNMISQNGTSFFMKVFPVQEANEDCRRSNSGWEYAGIQNVTESGIACQNWQSQTPHSHDFTDDQQVHENYCRNPDISHSGPWCYTMDPYVRWESCGIPFCNTTPRFCMSGDGASYFGSINVATGGYECQRWDSDEPHPHVAWGYYDYLPEQGNYCRNPYGSEVGPWCYTTNEDIRWDYCDIPKCE